MKSLGPIIVLAVASLIAHSASFNTNPTSDAFVAVPEPGPLALAVLGIVLLGGRRWLRGRK